MPINSIESLRTHLQWALEIEHATIPPYLCALYSIKPGHNIEAVEVIESIFLEEMLHMTLVANILNAVGGSPQIDKPGFLAQYPAYLPHSNKTFLVPLQKFSKESVEIFMKIEKPESHDAQPEDDNYHTIGQFYEAIEIGLKRLCVKLGESAVFTGDPTSQVSSDGAYYGGSGKIIAVKNLESALVALEEIKEQGEGLQHAEIWDGDQNMFHPERAEVAHYYRFHELLVGRNYTDGDTPESGPTGESFTVDWDAVYNIRPNPRAQDYPAGSVIREQLDDFNRTYSSVLRQLHRCFNGHPEVLGLATGTMYEVKIKAMALMQTPSGDGETTVGTSFEYVPQHEAQSTKKIVVRPNGPYSVHGGIPLVHKSQIISEHGEPLTWKTCDVYETDDVYVLCRCGNSKHKPFCDGTHVRVEFEGTETADTGLTMDRQEIMHGHGIVVKRDHSLCMEAGFCGNRFKKIADMMADSEDTQVRAQIMAMVERCPSGSFTYMVEHETIEPDFPQSIGVTTEGDYAGALWVTGKIPIERADGEPMEMRNRVTLCRCGQSSNKPLCDGTHRELGILE